MISVQYQRLLKKGFTRSGECLISGGTKTASGYAVVSINKKLTYAHRESWAQWNGKIPDGLVIDHECHNLAASLGECAGGSGCIHRACVNPAHLAVKTSIQNVQSSPLWGLGNGLAETCGKGHEFNITNTYWPPSGGSRQCRKCNAEKERRYRKAKKADGKR